MEKKQKPTDPQEQVTAHPETHKPSKRLPDAESSKVSTKQGDARTAHDKDGNEDHAKTGRRAV